MKKQKGVTLIALVITIVVILILLGIVLKLALGQDGIIDKAIAARFAHNYRSVEERVGMFYSEKQMEEASKRYVTSEKKDNIKDKLPLAGEVTGDQKNVILEENLTLAETIKRDKALGEDDDLSTVSIYWIDFEQLGIEMKNQYLIDLETMKIYDYEGEHFSKKRWHVLDYGAKEVEKEPEGTSEPDDIWDGWIRLELFYPSGATDKEWRLSEVGEIRTDTNLAWKKYTGPITVRISQVQNIWIRYKIGNDEYTIPPLGEMLVNINVTPTGGKQSEVKVSIDYDADATTKQYRINGGEWLDYTDEFTITENVLIEAKGIKTENVYDSDGNIILTRKVTGRDAYYVSNIGVPNVDNNLEAPTITRKSASSSDEVAQVEITYPDVATEKIYKVNYGENENYNGNISIKKYGTVVLAYYKTADGKVSPTSLLEINDTSTGNPAKEQEPFDREKKPTEELKDMLDVLAGPNIQVTNDSSGEMATITVTTAELARNIYIQLGNDAYVSYTEPITVNRNMTVRAYYVSELSGEKSQTSYALVRGLHQGNNPTVIIDADPYPYGNSSLVSEVKVTMTTDGSNLQYSYDGVKYQAYTGEITVKNNCRIYAKANNSYGTTVEYLDITNLSNTAPKKKVNLAVDITVTPEPTTSTSLVDKAKVTISADERAEKIYYSIGKYGDRVEYTGAFTVEQNCTVYAYATSSNGSGQASKLIDNLLSGVAEPLITISPSNGKQSKKTNVSIQFDKNATTKRYEIDGNGLRDYTGSFDVEKNCLIRAYNSNSKNSAESTLAVENITADPPTWILDYGDYYLLKLPFPDIAKNKEYKYKEEGIWKTYQEDGIILVKPEKLSDVIKNDKVNIKIKDENGNASDWMDYEKPITIRDKNTIIYAKGCDEAEVWSEIAMKEITNIDEEQPKIKLIADLENAQQRVGIRVIVTDDVKVEKVKWAKGQLGESYFSSNGTLINNNSIVYIEENGYYTFYAEDGVGNKQTYTLNVGNVDKTPPEIEITVNPEKAVGIKAEVTIDYGDSSTKQYKVGKSNTTWTDYTGSFSIESTTILAKNWQNDDGTVTVYAKGIDSAGNEITVSKKVLSLDLDAPSVPVINSKYGYPVLTEYGVSVDGSTTIVYDTRNDITNYYSTDGENWQIYTGEFQYAQSGTIHAKSVKNESGLTVYQSKSINMPSDALPMVCYDGDLNTNNSVSFWDSTTKNYYMNVDNSVIGKKVSVTYQTASKARSVNRLTIIFYNESGEVISTTEYINIAKTTVELTIPKNTAKINFQSFSMSGYATTLYEVRLNSEPVINSVKVYPKLTQYGMERGYTNVTINYFATSVQRLYSFDNVTWYNYQDKAIRVDYGTTIYAKGIDKNGTVTNISSLTSTVPSDAIGPAAYDGNESTYVGTTATTTWNILIDSSVQGSKADIKCEFEWNMPSYIYFYNEAGINIETKELFIYKDGSRSFYGTKQVTIPNGAVKMTIQCTNKSTTACARIKEIEIHSQPTVNATAIYPKLTQYGMERGYTSVTINYFATSVQRLYSFDNVTWYNYQDKAIRVDYGTTIYAKGIDKNGTVTNISSLTSTVPSDTIGPAAYDGNESTYVGTVVQNNIITTEWNILIDSSIQGSKVDIKCEFEWNMPSYIYFYNEAGINIETKELFIYKDGSRSFYGTKQVTIPNGAVKMKIQCTNKSTTACARIKEIEIN